MTTDTPRTDAASFSSRDPLELLQTSQQLERELSVSKAEVVALAQAIHSRTDPYPEWAICDSVTGIISQINNMVGGVLDRAEKAEAEVERLAEKLASLQEAYLQSVERDNNLTQELFDSRAEVEFWKSKAYEAEQSEGKREMEVDKLKELVKWYEARHSTIIST